MSVFRRWLDRLLGMQSDVEHQVEQSVRLNAALAGAVIRAEAVAQAQAFADEVEATNPQLAASIRASIAEQTGTTSVVDTVSPATPKPVELPAPTGKRPPGRPRKTAQLPPADHQPGGTLP